MNTWLYALIAMLAIALCGWAVSVPLRNVTLVDSLWSLLFVGGVAAFLFAGASGPRAVMLFSLIGIWAARLCVYLTRRNWRKAEDHRYAAIRARNEPGFTWKSAYLVFGLQALLAFIVSLPLLAALESNAPLNAWDLVGAALWLAGMIFESVGDAQLARFKADPANRGKVMDRGLWRYTRHPNYFGEACIWWGFYLIAAGAGAWWSVIGPLLMTLLLLRVSGVALLEKDIAERRPDYREYVLRTNAFFPGPSR